VLEALGDRFPAGTWTIGLKGWDDGFLRGLGSAFSELEAATGRLLDVARAIRDASTTEEGRRELQRVSSQSNSLERELVRLEGGPYPAAAGHLRSAPRRRILPALKPGGPVGEDGAALRAADSEADSIAAREFLLWILKDLGRSGRRPVVEEALGAMKEHPLVARFSARILDGSDPASLEAEIRGR
jgi:hypothetical protein